MASVADWVRLALTGDPASATPSSAIITMVEAGAQAELVARFPDCLTGGVLTGDDFLEALGYAIAAKILLAPGGQQFAQFVLSVKVGPTETKRVSAVQSAAEAQQVLAGLSGAALSRIECVRKALAQAPKPGFFAVASDPLARKCGCRRIL